jgi:hypothetical protein
MILRCSLPAVDAANTISCSSCFGTAYLCFLMSAIAMGLSPPLLIRPRHTSATLCGGCVVGCGQSVVASHTWPAPWLQGPATKLWHHSLATKPATFVVGLWCKCGGCVGQLCGAVVVGVWGCARPHPPCTLATPTPARPPCSAHSVVQRSAMQLV